MTVRRVMVLAGAAAAALWMAPLAGGLAGLGILGAGFAVGIVLVGLLLADLVEAIVEPTARPLGRQDRCRLCHARRLDVGGAWLCPRCDYADPSELDPEARHRGEPSAR
jgi:hypothetical protein